MALTSSSNLERVPAAPLPFGRVLGLDLLYSSCSLKPRLFFSVPQGREICSSVPQFLPTTVHSSKGGGSLHYHVSLSFAVCSLCGLFMFCCVEAVQSALSSSEGIAISIGVDVGCLWWR